MIRTLASPLWHSGRLERHRRHGDQRRACYGALAARYPQAGGGYVYLREAYGPRVAFLYGWKCLLIMDPGITAALATGFASYAAVLVPLGNAVQRVVAIAAIAGLALVHISACARHTAADHAGGAEDLRCLWRWLDGASPWQPAGRWRHFVPFARGRRARRRSGGAIAGAFVGAFFSFGGLVGSDEDGRRSAGSLAHAASCAASRARRRHARLHPDDARVHLS